MNNLMQQSLFPEDTDESSVTKKLETNNIYGINNDSIDKVYDKLVIFLSYLDVFIKQLRNQTDKQLDRSILVDLKDPLDIILSYPEVKGNTFLVRDRNRLFAPITTLELLNIYLDGNLGESHLSLLFKREDIAGKLEKIDTLMTPEKWREMLKYGRYLNTSSMCGVKKVSSAIYGVNLQLAYILDRDQYSTTKEWMTGIIEKVNQLELEVEGLDSPGELALLVKKLKESVKNFSVSFTNYRSNTGAIILDIRDTLLKIVEALPKNNPHL